MSSRNEQTSSKKERRRSTNRVQLEENVFTTQISHYHQTMGYYSGVGPPFIPDRNCYNNINWSSRAPPWTGWTPPPPGTWMTSSVSNGGMVPPPPSFPCRVPNRLPPSPFNPPAMPPQHTSVIDPLLGSMHTPASSNLRGWYTRYPNDIPIQEVPVVVPSGRLDNIECLRHVGNHIRADHNFVEKTLVQKCETTASVCGTTVTRRSWYKMPEKSPPQPSKEKVMKTSEKTENINVEETAVLPSKVKKMEDTVILSPDYCSKLSTADPSSKSSNCLPEVPNHNTSSSNFTEYFLKRLMKKHQKESNMKKISVSNAMTTDTESANIQAPSDVPEKRVSRVPIFKKHIPNSHSSKTGSRIIEDVIDLSRDSPPSSASEPNNNNNKNINCHQNEAASCDLVITNSYSLSFSGVPNKATNPSSLIGARLSPTKRKLPDTKPSTLEDNQKENLIVSESISDFQMKSKRKKYEPRKRDSFVLEEDTSCWVSGTMNKLIDSNFHSNDKHVLTPNIIEKTIPSDQSNKYLNKIDSDNAPEYCDIVDILHSLSESGPNSQGVHASNKESLLPKKDSILERKVIRTTNSVRNDKCITLDDTDDSDGTQSGETLTPCTVIRSRQSLDTLSTADNSVDSTISSSSLDNNDVEEEGIPEKEVRFSVVTGKANSKDQDNHSFTTSENTSSVLKENISLSKQKVEDKQLSPEISSNKELTKSTWMTLSLAKPSVCKLPKAILPIKKQPIEHRISDEELETLEGLGQKGSGENVAVATSASNLKIENSSPNKDKPANDVIIMSDTHTSVVSEKTLTENTRPIKILNSSENPIAIIDDRLENSEGASSVGNESDDSLPSVPSISESPLPEGIGTADDSLPSVPSLSESPLSEGIGTTEKDGKESAASNASFINQDAENLSIANTKQILDPALKVSSLADESGNATTRSNNLCDQRVDRDAPNDKEMMLSRVVDSLESQKQQQKQTVSQQQETNSSFSNSVLNVEQVKKSLLSRSSNNIFTLTTSPLKSKTTTSLMDCNETVPTPTLQQPRLEVVNLSKKVLSCNNLKEINQTPCLEISENGDMKVIAIVTDYEESACDSLLGLAEPDGVLGKNSNVIVTSIDSSKKDAVLEYSEHTNGSPFKEFHKSKMLSLTEINKCKNTKENRSLFSSFLNCHEEKDLFSKNSNGDIVVLNDPAPKVKQHTHFSSHSVRSSGIRDKVVSFDAPNSSIGLNIMSVELKQPPSTIDYSADKFVGPLVSSLVDKCINKLNFAPTINNHSLENQEKTPKAKNEKLSSAKPQSKAKVKNYLKKFKRRKISQKMLHSKKMYRQFKKKYMSLGMKIHAVEFQDSLVSCNQKEDVEPVTDTSKDGKVPLPFVSKVGSRTPLAKYDLNILRARISSACPDRRGRIFRSPQQESDQVKDKTSDSVASLDKQCQTNSPFYGCLTHAFKGSCYQKTERRISPIIHKFVKFHGHKLLCVIINVKKYVIIRELVQKCFQGKNQVHFYRTKYRDYSFPYLELPFHMKSFALKYLLESGSLLTGNRATPLGIMLLSDAEIIYHFFYSFRECNLTACVQDWDPDDRGVYDCDWLKVLDTAPAVSMKTEPLDTVTDTGLPGNYLCTCNHASNNFASALGQCRVVARQPVKRPMSGIFEPSFESPVFGTTSSSTQTSPLDTNFSIHPEPDDDVSTNIIKRDNSDPNIESSCSTISLEESLMDSNSRMTRSNSDLVSTSSDYCDYVSKPISADFVFEAHRNVDDDDDSSCGSEPPTYSHFSPGLPLEDPPEGSEHKINLPLSDPTQTHEFVLGGMTLLDGKVVRFVELNGQRHFLLIDINSSWTLSGILDRLLESEIVVQKCSPSQRSFLLNLNRTLPQTNADDMLLVADEVFPKLKTCLTLTSFNSSCHRPHMVPSKPDPEPLTLERQTHCPNESQSEQNYLFSEKQR